ncbi:hypothetical protein BURMUCGD1_4993 [Burkholderia multivorans CGD1]|nr:hypothetical protein BURMUCGD1_4993 [Burkholderia multivorans CGD1]
MIVRILARYRFPAQSSVKQTPGRCIIAFRRRPDTGFPDEKPEPSPPLRVARCTRTTLKQRISADFSRSRRVARHAGNANPDANFQCEWFVIFFAQRE